MPIVFFLFIRMEKYLHENEKYTGYKFLDNDDIHFGCSGAYGKFMNKEMKIKMQTIYAIQLDFDRLPSQRIQDPDMIPADHFCENALNMISGKSKIVAIDASCVAEKKLKCHDDCVNKNPIDNKRLPYR